MATEQSELKLEAQQSESEQKPTADSENGVSKRPREELEADESVEKKPKTEAEKEEPSPPVVIDMGPKKFSNSVELFEYLFKILHTWPPNVSLNKYEHLVLLEVLKKGHVEAEKKIGGKEVKSFQIRFHPQFKSRCFFLVRDDDSAEDFSFRKCVDHILPLPEDFQVKHHVNKSLGGRGGGGRGARR